MKKRRTMSIVQACKDKNLFGPWFTRGGDWSAWMAFLATAFGLQMSEEQRSIYHGCTGRSTTPTAPVKEAWMVIGRRGGKSFILALIAVYVACFRDYRPYLAPGERATVMIIAADRRQARIVLRYVRALLSVPMLRRLVVRETAEAFDLSNSTTIEVHTATFRGTRGYTLAAAICDELAFWSVEGSSEPDFEILNSLRPGMVTLPHAMLLCASSPYARRGALFEAWKRYYGQDDPNVLVWKAATRVMNPSIRQSVIDAEMERDPSHAQAEYFAQFRTDIESYIAREVVEACTDDGVFERPVRAGFRYTSFVDPSGGSSDSFTIAISHRDGDSIFLDAVREVRPPFSPESVVVEFAELLKAYRISRVVGDRFGGEWPREQFRKYGIAYEIAPKPKSDLYRDLLPLLNSRRVTLLDNVTLREQLVRLERRTARSGRDSIDHAPAMHDDLANAVAGALVLAEASQRRRIRAFTLGAGPRFEIDPTTGRPIEQEHISALDPRKNGCIPGAGIASEPWHAARAVYYNSVHNIRRPRS